MKKTYRTYTIYGNKAYSSGAKFHQPSNSTIQKLRELGVGEIIWQNGDFLVIG